MEPMLKKCLFLVVSFVAFSIVVKAQETQPSDASVISIINTDSAAAQKVAPATADTSTGPYLRDVPATKRNYPKEVPEPDYSNYHPVKSTDNSGAEKSTGTSDGIPVEFSAVDDDHDGKISTKEIFGTIDGFFDGQSTFTVDQIRKLIDYFFDQ